MAVLQGIFWVMLIHPGKRIDNEDQKSNPQQEGRPITTADTILDLIRLVDTKVIKIKTHG